MKKLLFVLIMACIPPAMANMTETQGAANASDPDFAAGKAADLVVWPTRRPGDLSYWIAGMAPERIVQAGREKPAA